MNFLEKTDTSNKSRNSNKNHDNNKEYEVRAIQMALNDKERLLCDRYLYSNYVNSLTENSELLKRSDIMELEKATRNQAKNALWNVLRLDRQTASSANVATLVPTTAAMSFGIAQEKIVKKNEQLINQIRQCVEKTMGERVAETVLECGMFLSRRGLNSASPDAYMRMATPDETLVPIEIKCPSSYANTTVDDVRNAMNTRKPRYRVKRTALSVNRSGQPIFVVEAKDPHYRQMQRQMYVLDSPLCVYVVRFKDSHVVMTVNRDVEFYNKENETERVLYETFVQRNKHDAVLVHQRRRIDTFSNKQHNLCKEDIARLTHDGFYYKFGVVVCAFCRISYEIDAADTGSRRVDTILREHRNLDVCRADKDDRNKKIIQHKHPEYFQHKARVETLTKANLDPRLADRGVFYMEASGDDKTACKLVTFCCDASTTDTKSTTVLMHAADCEYIKIIDRRGAATQ
ncbi:alk-exo [Lambdina fiscellaria nucleopolyhedrovirus]|uniref:Alk-exo n=1 Tax=Lambdina fiscellaria nucleopolyhedrovirus TaxID=1642929 RepID=A0A0E3Z884_9ABAC|nr:alk-exo [Lambdina fiscellaria nucleopolyhedrovirus]AKC91642.1 alk-exo [Lambdina fiscellaria nucleopolyhedrovirus]